MRSKYLSLRMVGAAVMVMVLLAALACTKEVIKEVEKIVTVEKIVVATARAEPTQAPPGTIVRGNTLRIGTAQVVQFLDPHRGGLSNNRNAFVGLYTSLTDWDFDGLAQTQMAESWDVSSDGLTWTFKLQDNIKFHDGRAFTAADVKLSMERIFNPDQTSFIAQYISETDSTEVVDDLTIRFHLSKPSGALLPGLIDAKIVAKENVDQDNFDTAPIGTGPFKFVEYLVNDRVVLEKFEDYWEVGGDGGSLPYLDRVEIRTLADPTALYTALITGIVDVYWQITPKFVVGLQQAGITEVRAVSSTFSTNYTSFFFEITDVDGNPRGPFQDIRVREAFVLAQDRQGLIDAGYEGLAETNPTNGNFAPGGFFTNPNIPELPQNVARAKQLFADAGVTELTGWFTAENAEFRPMSLVFEKALEDAGVKLAIDIAPLETWFGWLGSFRSQNWRVDDAFAPNIRFLPPEPSRALTGWECGNHFVSGWCSAEMDKWSLAGREASDPLVRKDAYFKYQEAYQKEFPAFNCCWRPNWHGESEDLDGLRDLFGNFNYTRAWLRR